MEYTQEVTRRVAAPAFKYGFKISTRDPLKPTPESLPWYERQRALCLLRTIAEYKKTGPISYVWLPSYARTIAISVTTEEGIGGREIPRIIVMVLGPRDLRPDETDIISIETFEDEESARAHIQEVARRIRNLTAQGKIPFIHFGKLGRRRRRGRRVKNDPWLHNPFRVG